MVRGIVDHFKCSSFFSFLRLYMSAGSLFLAYLCPSIYGAAFYRMFTSRCLCAVIGQCTITPLCFLFVWLNCNCKISAGHSVFLYFLCHHSKNLKLVFICCEGAIASLLWTAHFYFPIKEGLLFQQRIIKWPAQR